MKPKWYQPLLLTTISMAKSSIDTSTAASALLSSSSHELSQWNLSKSLLLPFSVHYFQDSKLWISGYSDTEWTEQQSPSFSDFKDYQCSVTSVLLYQIHTWPSAFWGHMFYNHMLALFSEQAPEWQSKHSHLGDSKHRRQEVWWRNRRPLSIHYLSEINESFLWPTRRKIRTVFTSRCSAIHQYMSVKQ